MRFWFPWAVDALVATIFVGFFVVGLADGTVSSFNILLWLGMLAGLTLVVGGSLWLRAHDYGGGARRLVWLLAVPALLVGLLFLTAMILQPRWN